MSSMLTAKRTFTATLDGELVQIIAGRDRVVEGHELVKRHPEAFAPEAPLTSPRRRSKPFVPVKRPPSSTPSWRLPEAVELRTDTVADLQVDITPAARRDLLEHAQRAQDGRETGGALAGPLIQSWRPVRIFAAGGPGILARRTPTRFVLDDFHDRRFVGDDVYVGHWHSHPEPRSGDPSRTDLETWARMRRELDVRGAAPAFLGVVLTPDPARGWDAPRLDAWLVRQRHGRNVCERVTTPTGWQSGRREEGFRG